MIPLTPNVVSIVPSAASRSTPVPPAVLSRDKHAAARQRQQHVGARARIARRERCRAAIGEGRVEGPIRKQAIDARIRKAGANEGADQIAPGDVEFEAQRIRRRRQARE